MKKSKVVVKSEEQVRVPRFVVVSIVSLFVLVILGASMCASMFFALAYRTMTIEKEYGFELVRLGSQVGDVNQTVYQLGSETYLQFQKDLYLISKVADRVYLIENASGYSFGSMFPELEAQMNAQNVQIE